MALHEALQEIDRLMEREKWPDAEAATRRALGAFGPLDPLRGRLATILTASGDNAQALDILQTLHPLGGSLELIQVLLLYRLHHHEEGEEAVQAVCGHARDFKVDDLFELARELYEEGCHRGAARILSATLPDLDEDDARSFHALTGLALCSAAAGDDDALDRTEAALVLRPDDGLLRSVRANLLIDAGRRHEGLRILEELGPNELSRLQSDVGLKRLLREWRRRNSSDARLRSLEDAVHRLDTSLRWNSLQELVWAECAAEDSRQCLFLADCPASGRLVGYAFNPEFSAAPLVALAAEGSRRLTALEEGRFWGIPVHENSHLVARHYGRLREKVVEEPGSPLWSYLQAARSGA